MRENVEIEEAQIVEAFEPLRTEAFQQQLTEQAESVLFDGEEGATNTAKTVGEFVDDYLTNGRTKPIDQWLIGRFSRYPEIWENEQEKIDTANTIISTVESLVGNQLEVEKHLNAGKSLVNFLNKKIETVAKAENLSAEEIAQGIDEGLNKANQAFTELYTGTAVDLNPAETLSQGLDLVRHISKRTEMNANLNLAWYGAKSIGSRLWKAATGQENLSRAEELTKIIRGAVESAENKGVQVAMSGGMVVSAKKGWVKNVFDRLETIEKQIEKAQPFLNTVQLLTLNVAEGLNDTRILDKAENKEYQYVDIIADKVKFMVAKIVTAIEQDSDYWCSEVGEKGGMWLGTTIGLLFNPAAAVIGGKIGSWVGERAGQLLGETIIKPIAILTIKKYTEKAIDFLANSTKKIISQGEKMVKQIGRTITNRIKNNK